MTLQELANQEKNLYSKALELYHQAQSIETSRQLSEVFVEYKKVHQTYADLSNFNIEALKRGLFIQWYALTEPSYLTGISDLEENAEDKVLQSLKQHIETDKIDKELIFMLNWYLNWDWVFEKHKTYYPFDGKIVNEENNRLPKTIDKVGMELRGQLGKYWNSLSAFKHL